MSTGVKRADKRTREAEAEGRVTEEKQARKVTRTRSYVEKANRTVAVAARLVPELSSEEAGKGNEKRTESAKKKCENQTLGHAPTEM